MNIVEASAHIAKGHLVRRTSWKSNRSVGQDQTGLYVKIEVSGMSVQSHFSLGLKEIQAKDWEIVTQENRVSNFPKLSLRRSA